MSDTDVRPDLDELDDPEFEEALRARTRRRWIMIAGGLVVLVGLFNVPWKESVSVSGRVAPARWAKVRSEVPGLVREVRRHSGDLVQEGDVIAVLDSEEQRDALEASRLLDGSEHADHGTDGVADEDDVFEAELVTDLEHVVGVALERAVLRAAVGAQIRTSRPDVVEQDDPVRVREGRRDEAPHVLIAAVAVGEHDRLGAGA